MDSVYLGLLIENLTVLCIWLVQRNLNIKLYFCAESYLLSKLFILSATSLFMVLIYFLFIYRADTTHLLRHKRLPLGSVDSEDGGAFVDDEVHTLLPGTRTASNDDLSQVGSIE